MTVLSSAYLGPIGYYALITQSDEVVVDVHEHYLKQTIRNRSYIENPEGYTALSIPIVKQSGKAMVNDIGISFKENWKKDHWRSITSTYNSSPFFKYYDYLFEPIFLKEIKSLTDFNLALLNITLQCLDVKTKITYSSSYVENPDKDYRNYFNVKDPTQCKISIPHYHQVFHGEQNKFIPNLSIIDLLFNEGPASKDILKEVVFQEA